MDLSTLSLVPPSYSTQEQVNAMSTIETTPQLPVSVDDTTTTTPASGQVGTPAPAAQSGLEDFENWIKDFKKYESILGQVSKATKDTKFKDELKTIEQYAGFKLLNESERTASLYTLLQHSTQDQARFYVAILQRIIKPEEAAPAPVPTPEVKPKLGKLSFRGPSLNIDALESPLTPTPAKEDTHVSAIADAAQKRQDTPSVESNWSNVGNTPIASGFQKDKAVESNSTASLPGFPGINPYTLNMLANAGLSNEAQLLAAQLVMSGIVQPTGLAAATSAKPKKAPQSPWRTAPSSARFPSSALRSSGLRPSSGLKSAGLKGSSLAQPQTPLSAMESPREEDFNPEMLKDIPGWLRTLRLHKYTQCFDGLTWEEMVVLDDATLEAKGIAALGARRRLLRTFEHVRKVMGIDEPSSATPTTTTMPTGPAFKAVSEAAADRVPHSAVPLTRSKLSINSPIFTPTWEQGKLPTSATPEVPAEAPVPEPTVAVESVQ